MTLQSKINIAPVPLTQLSFYLMLLTLAANAWLQGAPCGDLLSLSVPH